MIRKNNKGFTMIELMVVIVIMGVLAVLAIPKLTDVITKAKFGEIPICVGTWEHAMLAYQAETGSLATDATNLTIEDPSASSKWFGYAQNQLVYTAKVKAGVAVSTYTDQSNGATSTAAVNNGAVGFAHARGDFAAKYLPNFQ